MDNASTPTVTVSGAVVLNKEREALPLVLGATMMLNGAKKENQPPSTLGPDDHPLPMLGPEDHMAPVLGPEDHPPFPLGEATPASPTRMGVGTIVLPGLLGSAMIENRTEDLPVLLDEDKQLLLDPGRVLSMIGAEIENKPGSLQVPALIFWSGAENPSLPLDEDPTLALGEPSPGQLAPGLTKGTVEDQHDFIIPIPDEIVEENTTTTGGGVPVNGVTDRHSGDTTGGQIVPMCHEVMKYMIPCLVLFATLMYQGKPGALLAENPVAVSSFLLSYCVYWLIVRKMKEMPIDSSETKQFRILNQIAFVCGLVSAASPLFILLINHHKLPLLHHLFWMVLAVGFLWLLLFCSYVYLCVGDAVQEGAGGQPAN